MSETQTDTAPAAPPQREKLSLHDWLHALWGTWQRMDERKADINKVIEPLAENYLRLNALGAYGAFFNIYYCSIRMKINGPAGSDILIPFGGPPDPSKGRCSENG